MKIINNSLEHSFETEKGNLTAGSEGNFISAIAIIINLFRCSYCLILGMHILFSKLLVITKGMDMWLCNLFVYVSVR